MTTLCISCKGKGLCGRELCPVLERFKSPGYAPHLSDNIFGASPPSVFIGRYGYPYVSAGPLVPPDVIGKEAHTYDDPASWDQLSIHDIIHMRASLVRSNLHCTVSDASSPDTMLQKSQELALSQMPVDTEVWFRRPPHRDLRFDGVLSPMGPSGEVIRLDIAQNPVVPRQVDKIVLDTDVRAADAVDELYRSHIPADHITRLLSIGLLGKERKLVPTRWSITATDDMIGKMLLDEIVYLPEVNDIRLYRGGLHGNHFEILMFPGPFAFEMIEIWLPRAVWSGESTTMEADWEDFKGKKGYSSLGGGYYAARLPVLEHLARIRRSASIVAVREITPDYWAPLGVWVVREAARRALFSAPLSCASLEEALITMSACLHNNVNEWRPLSRILDKKMNQKTLTDFI